MATQVSAVGAVAKPRKQLRVRLKPDATFFAVSALVFAASAALTTARAASMSSMGEMLMPAGWTMSMMWMRMPGQTWVGVAVSFMAMWVVMMVAMMLPSLIPVLWQYRETLRRQGAIRIGLLTTLVGAGYFFVWAVFGLAAFPLGIALTMIGMRQPAVSQVVPFVIGAVVLIAGSMQFTAWKARQLACCRDAAVPVTGPPTLGHAWRHGVRFGLQCGPCCANLMVILLVLGVMDLWVMAVVTAAITIERLAPAGDRVARATGAIALCAGLLLIARAAGLA